MPQLTSFLKPDTFDELESVFRTASDLLTPAFTNKANILVSNADSLLPSDLVLGLKDILGDVTPLLPEVKKPLTPSTINAIDSLLTNAIRLCFRTAPDTLRKPKAPVSQFGN